MTDKPKPVRPSADKTSPDVPYDPTAADLEYWAEHGAIEPPEPAEPTKPGALEQSRARHWVDRAKANIANSKRKPHPGPIYPDQPTKETNQ